MGPHPDEVNARLAAAVAALAEALFPDGRIDGREWRGHGADGATWGVVVRGGKVGCWRNFGSGLGGRALLSLVRDAACDGDHLAAYRWALDWLGGTGAVGGKADRSASARRERLPPPAPSAGNGMRLYLSGTPFADWASPIGRYLIGRAIPPDAFAGPMTGLRYRADTWNADAGRAMPAMLAPVFDPLTRKHIATHRTYLTQTGAFWGKAAVTKPKKILGSPAGGIIPLTKGSSGKHWRDMPSGENLVLAEGIENALSLAAIYRGFRAAAYVSAGNILALELPEQVKHIVLARDRDGMNEAVTASRDDAIYYWQRERRTVEIWDPPDGCHDVNDYLVELAHGRRAA
jgi:hypothetical protein